LLDFERCARAIAIYRLDNHIIEWATRAETRSGG
jgi:hypothetical protein